MKPQMNADERRSDFLPHEVGEDQGGGLHADAEPRPEAPSLTLSHFVGAGISSPISVLMKKFLQATNNGRDYVTLRAAEPAPDLIRGAQEFLSAFIPSYQRSSAFPFFSVNLCVSVPLWFKATGSMPPA
jgi:hypothetical protein